MKIVVEENLGTFPILNNSGGLYNYMNHNPTRKSKTKLQKPKVGYRLIMILETLVLVQGPQNHN